MDRKGRTRTWDAAHELATQTYFPHRLRPLDRQAPDFRLNAIDYGPVTIGRITFGRDVAIQCEYPGAIEVNFPLTGGLESRIGSTEVLSGAGRATVFAAGERHDITRWSHDCDVLGVKFDEAWLRDRAARGFGVHGALALPRQLDLRQAPTADWFRLLQGLHSSGASGGPVALTLADALATSFLLSVLPETGPNPVAGGPAVAVVLEALAADPGRDWTALAMAEVAGVSVRRLQESFAKELGKTPRQKLTELRLDRARTDLRAGTGTVAEVAANLGFGNPGRFAAAYRERWGVLPKEDLPR
ncbi:AraC family transcriptional regulator [Granulicoccus phenolivorans]|uniref:AraC family transcriptional regulator n=1 Tax=Granulicoccus phenolivorans TaxID=266854 RepID=UPI0003F86BE4|nr:AraC family transcriptional regulator [Granulicoccus phenolivorans]